MSTSKSTSANTEKPIRKLFEKISGKVTRATGSPGAFIGALTVILVWLLTGPIFDYSDTWQLIINTGTTIITFLMVFIIQQSQNKETTALQIKINELIACNEQASNRLINAEGITEKELETLKKFYVELSQMSAKDGDLYSSHSLDEAKRIHSSKINSRKNKTTK